MRRVADAAAAVAVTLWAGGLWAIGYIAAPTLFAQLADRMLAGTLAGRMFTVVAWVGIACAGYLITYLLVGRGWSAFRSAAFWIVVAMLLLTLAGHFGIQPLLAEMREEAFPRQVMETVLRDRFATWHGISSGLYLMESLLGVALVLLHGRGAR